MYKKKRPETKKEQIETIKIKAVYTVFNVIDTEEFLSRLVDPSCYETEESKTVIR